MATFQPGQLCFLNKSRLPRIVLRVPRCVVAPQDSLHGGVQHACCAKRVATSKMSEANFHCGTVWPEERRAFSEFGDLPRRGLGTADNFSAQPIQTPSLLRVNYDLL